MAQLANRRLAMTLFSTEQDPYSHMVRIVLAEKGIQVAPLTSTKSTSNRILID